MQKIIINIWSKVDSNHDSKPKYESYIVLIAPISLFAVFFARLSLLIMQIHPSSKKLEENSSGFMFGAAILISAKKMVLFFIS